jgi:hypothetical protein
LLTKPYKKGLVAKWDLAPYIPNNPPFTNMNWSAQEEPKGALEQERNPVQKPSGWRKKKGGGYQNLATSENPTVSSNNHGNNSQERGKARKGIGLEQQQEPSPKKQRFTSKKAKRTICPIPGLSTTIHVNKMGN